MSFWDAFILGLVQGISEFLPISSTAHIVLAGHFLGVDSPGLALEIFLHLASVLAVMLYFRRDILEVITGFLAYLRHRREEDRARYYFALYIVVATFITGTLGLLLADSLGEQIRNPYVMGGALWVTAGFLIFIEKGFTYGERMIDKMTWRDSVLVGLGQTVAVLPGISRSGATLVTALLCGLERETAVRYSFLLAIPVILGSSVLGFRHATPEWVAASGVGPLSLAFVVSLVASWLGIVWLIRFLRHGRLYVFALYCFMLGTLAMIFMR